MYYRDKGKPIREEYVETKKPPKESSEDKSGFPFWLLIVIIVVVVGCGLGLLFTLRQKEKGQDFGFQFY